MNAELAVRTVGELAVSNIVNAVSRALGAWGIRRGSVWPNRTRGDKLLARMHLQIGNGADDGTNSEHEQKCDVERRQRGG